jgi:hypothetical protein
VADGLNFFTDLNKLAQSVSAAPDKIDDNVAEIVETALKHAADSVRDIVNDPGGRGTKKGGPRVLSGEMLESVGYDMGMNRRGRIQGKYGFVHGAPFWTKYQERGTSRIPAMMALATTNQSFVDELEDQLQSGRWMDVI